MDIRQVYEKNKSDHLLINDLIKMSSSNLVLLKNLPLLQARQNDLYIQSKIKSKL